MITDADTKYKDVINFLEEVNKNFGEHEQRAKEPGEYIG